jgi:hypothetical protein
MSQQAALGSVSLKDAGIPSSAGSRPWGGIAVAPHPQIEQKLKAKPPG